MADKQLMVWNYFAGLITFDLKMFMKRLQNDFLGNSGATGLNFADHSVKVY